MSQSTNRDKTKYNHHHHHHHHEDSPAFSSQKRRSGNSNDWKIRKLSKKLKRLEAQVAEQSIKEKHPDTRKQTTTPAAEDIPTKAQQPKPKKKRRPRLHPNKKREAERARLRAEQTTQAIAQTSEEATASSQAIETLDRYAIISPYPDVTEENCYLENAYLPSMFSPESGFSFGSGDREIQGLDSTCVESYWFTQRALE